MKPYHTITLDIETVPRGEYTPAEYGVEVPVIDDIVPHKTIKDPTKALLYRENKLISEDAKWAKDADKFMDADMQAWKRRSLNDKTCQVISISVKFDDDPVQSFAGADEVDNLRTFMMWIDDRLAMKEITLKDVLWVGHNILGFDFNILRSKLMAVQGLRTEDLLKNPFFLPDWTGIYPHKYIPWKEPGMQDRPYVFDFMFHLPSVSATFVDKEGKTRTGKSLDVILQHYGYEGKKGCDGSDVYGLWCDGDLDTIVSYNKDEVEQMSAMFKNLPLWWK